MDRHDLAQFLAGGGQREVWSMINIDLPCEIVGIERQPPAIPDDVQRTIRNKDTAAVYVLCCRKRTLPCGASAREQRVLVDGI